MTVDTGTLLLAVISFLTGTLFPIIYKRLTYEGIAIRQPFRLDVILSEDSRYVFGTVLKIANTQKESALIDRIKLVLPRRGNRKVYVGVSDIKIQFLVSGAPVYFPLDTDMSVTDSTSDQGSQKTYHFPTAPSFLITSQVNYTSLPFIVKPNEERLIALEFAIPKDLNKPLTFDGLQTHTDRKQQIKILFRINGRYRDYVVRMRSDR